MTMFALVDGEPSPTLPVTDSTVLRGDGAFEAIRSYQGQPFALGEHLDRLEQTAAMLSLPLPRRDHLETWCRQAAAQGDGVVRVVVSRGDAVPGGADRPRCIVLHHPLPAPIDRLTLLPVTAPWHPAGRDWALAGAKTTSYAPNLAAGRLARERGYDDALLLSDDGLVLEGPTFSVAWVREGRLETPALDLLILDSITRRHLLAAAAGLEVEVVEGRFPVSSLPDASEVVAVSTVKEVTPVVQVGAWHYRPGPVAAKLAVCLRSRIDQEIRAQGG